MSVKKNIMNTASMIALVLLTAACATPSVEKYNTPKKILEDPRGGLKPGLKNPGTAINNLEIVTSIAIPEGFYNPDALWSPKRERDLARRQQAGEDLERPPSPISFASTDLAFSGSRIIQGNFHGLNIYNFSENGDTEVLLSLVCPGGQGDVSVHGDLLFYSVEQNRARLDCGTQGVDNKTSTERFRGIRIFDISNIRNPVQVAAIQTCRGSHTHTLVPNPIDTNSVYIYVSGTAGIRPGTELEGCVNGQPEDAPDTALYSIDIIKVPLKNPEQAKIVNSPRIFSDPESGKINGLWNGGKLEAEAQTTASTNSCHDITVYPAYNLAAGACAGNGILLDISNPEKPERIADIADPNMAYWHSATFSNDAQKILFTDEWGGGIGARCTKDDPENWGADIITTITDKGFEKRGFFKIPGNQSPFENCVAHNGMLIPVPGRDIMVQGWYSGGISVVDFTNPDRPFEIAYFDRGPLAEAELFLGGYWAAYWHNGRIFGSEIVRGLDIFKLIPSEHLSAAEIEAAERVQFDTANTQTQEKIIWDPHWSVAQAYVDQLTRDQAINSDLSKTVAQAIERWKNKSDTSALLKSATKIRQAADGTDGQTRIRLEALADIFTAAS